jgi:DNA sulfur modification protein DndC
MNPNVRNSKSAFKEYGLKKTVNLLIEEIQDIYLSDQIPWVVGYSGGKDSTATLQLVWLALAELAPEQRIKPVHVISTDTLVENPVVAAWVTRSLEAMKGTAQKEDLPIYSHRLTPEVTETFWVNLIGRGYPAPRPKFRWCTERLKIKPANAFITKVVRDMGEAIVVLGTRKAESAARSRTIEKHQQKSTRDRLNSAALLPNAFYYTPIDNWSNDEVWLFLMQVDNPWGYDNKDLLTMYQGASPDGECPLVVDTTTPSCGDSRFGCWVCTLVDKDKSMQAMVQNDDEKEWMLPLLELRNDLDIKDDRHLRDFRRMSGTVTLYKDRHVPGPYVQAVREEWLRRVLEAQKWIRENGPSHVRDIELISIAELHEIRRIWVVDKHELEDNLPRVYEEVMGHQFPGQRMDDNLAFGADEIRLLSDICDGDSIHFELLRELIDIERRYRTMARRSGLYEALEGAFKRNFYSDAEDATNRARRQHDVKTAIEKERGNSPQANGKLRQQPLLSTQPSLISLLNNIDQTDQKSES